MGEHDQIFKHTFRLAEHAAGELRSVLPPALAELIDFDSLELVQSDIVDRKLAERFSDALFRANFGRTSGYVWLLLEHQSSPDHFMTLRVLEHLLRSWFELLRRERDRRTLPPVVCVVVHHGEHGWTAPVELHDLVEGVASTPSLAPLVPNFQIIVDDLSTRSDTELLSRPVGLFPKTVLWALRDARNIERFYRHLAAWAASLQQLYEKSPEDARTLMRYILAVAGNQQFETIKKRIVEVAPNAEDAMMTAAQELKAEGRAESILTVLEARSITLTTEQRERVSSCRDTPQLDRWLRRAVTVGSAEELFA